MPWYNRPSFFFVLYGTVGLRQIEVDGELFLKRFWME